MLVSDWSSDVCSSDLRLDLNLLAAGNGVRPRADPAAGCRADRGTLASAYDGAEDGTHCRTAANFFGGVLAAALALPGVGLGCTGNVLAFVVDRGQRDGEQRAALVVLGILRGVDMAGDLSALRQHDHAVFDDVGGDRAGKLVACLGAGAIESLRDA